MRRLTTQSPESAPKTEVEKQIARRAGQARGNASEQATRAQKQVHENVCPSQGKEGCEAEKGHARMIDHTENASAEHEAEAQESDE